MFLLLMGLGSQAIGCPNCTTFVSDAAEASAQAMSPAQVASLGTGFYWSILLMMSLPFLCVGGFGGALWLNHRQRAARTNQPR